MSSRNRKSRASLNDEKLHDSLHKEPVEELLANVSLENVPLEERRKEAQKPLFLTRYE